MHVRYVFEFCLLKIYSNVYLHGEDDADDDDDNTLCTISPSVAVRAYDEMIERQYETAADREQNKERGQWKEM